MTVGQNLLNEVKPAGGWLLRGLGSILVLAVLWLLLSGIYQPLIMVFGLCSVLTAIFVVKRMDAVDGDQVKILLKPGATISYTGWLLVEIAKANWAVTKTILSPKMLVNQHMFPTKYTQRTDLGQVIFANSITLTPGTISVETEDGQFLVHAVSYSEADHMALADMDRRVTAIEKADIQ